MPKESKLTSKKFHIVAIVVVVVLSDGLGRGLASESYDFSEPIKAMLFWGLVVFPKWLAIIGVYLARKEISYSNKAITILAAISILDIANRYLLAIY